MSRRIRYATFRLGQRAACRALHISCRRVRSRFGLRLPLDTPVFQPRILTDPSGPRSRRVSFHLFIGSRTFDVSLVLKRQFGGRPLYWLMLPAFDPCGSFAWHHGDTCAPRSHAQGLRLLHRCTSSLRTFILSDFSLSDFATRPLSQTMQQSILTCSLKPYGSTT